VIFIAKNYDGKVMSVVLARSYEMAQAYWQGRKVYAHTVETRTEKDLEDHTTGVLPIVNTKEITRFDIDRHTRNAVYLVISND